MPSIAKAGEIDPTGGPISGPPPYEGSDSADSMSSCCRAREAASQIEHIQNAFEVSGDDLRW